MCIRFLFSCGRPISGVELHTIIFQHHIYIIAHYTYTRSHYFVYYFIASLDPDELTFCPHNHLLPWSYFSSMAAKNNFSFPLAKLYYFKIAGSKRILPVIWCFRLTCGRNMTDSLMKISSPTMQKNMEPRGCTLWHG